MMFYLYIYIIASCGYKLIGIFTKSSLIHTAIVSNSAILQFCYEQQPENYGNASRKINYNELVEDFIEDITKIL